MSTRSATIIRYAEGGEVMRFYRHFDGYPEGHGLEMAEILCKMAVSHRFTERGWLAGMIAGLSDTDIDIESKDSQHGDLSYLYIVEADMSQCLYRKDFTESLPITISVFEAGWDMDYEDITKEEPIFSGTPKEYLSRYSGV